jgi:hypothetical protein
MLTKGSTQSDIKNATGADVVTRGKYYSDKSLATAKDPPLYLHVTAATEEILEKAVEMIDELMAKAALPPVIEKPAYQNQRQMVGITLPSSRNLLGVFISHFLRICSLPTKSWLGLSRIDRSVYVLRLLDQVASMLSTSSKKQGQKCFWYDTVFFVIIIFPCFL